MINKSCSQLDRKLTLLPTVNGRFLLFERKNMEYAFFYGSKETVKKIIWKDTLCDPFSKENIARRMLIKDIPSLDIEQIACLLGMEIEEVKVAHNKNWKTLNKVKDIVQDTLSNFMANEEILSSDLDPAFNDYLIDCLDLTVEDYKSIGVHDHYKKDENYRYRTN